MVPEFVTFPFRSGALSRPENPASKPIGDDEDDELADEAPCRSGRTIEDIMAERKDAEELKRDGVK